MAITQLSAFLENTPGTLYQAVSAISDAGINLRALSVADTRDFGILRMIVSDVSRTKEVLGEYTLAAETKVIAVKMDDHAGALKNILKIMEEAAINIEYVYAFTAAVAGSAYVVMRVNDIEEAEAVLSGNGIVTLSDEDLGIVLGAAFAQALGDKRGINRYGSCVLPMDEALILTAADLSGRACLVFDLPLASNRVGDFDTELVKEFFLGFVRSAACTLHIRELSGDNTHHVIEGTFKSFARTMRSAVAADPEAAGEIPSTKGLL